MQEATTHPDLGSVFGVPTFNFSTLKLRPSRSVSCAWAGRALGSFLSPAVRAHAHSLEVRPHHNAATRRGREGSTSDRRCRDCVKACSALSANCIPATHRKCARSGLPLRRTQRRECWLIVGRFSSDYVWPVLGDHRGPALQVIRMAHRSIAEACSPATTGGSGCPSGSVPDRTGQTCDRFKLLPTHPLGQVHSP